MIFSNKHRRKDDFLLRRPIHEDISLINKLNEKFDFYLPQTFLEAAVVQSEKDLVAFGMIRRIIEVIMVSEGSKREVLNALDMLISQAILDAKTHGYDQLHSFVTDEKFAKLLEDRFGFKECRGKALVLNIEG